MPKSTFFSRLARCIARRPVVTIAVCLAAFLVCIPGMLLLDGSENMFGFIKIMVNFMDTFTFTTTDEYKDYERATAIFPDTRSLVFLAKPLGGRGIVSSEVIRQIHQAEFQIKDVTRFTSEDGRELGFRDVCEKFSSDSPCITGSATTTLLGMDVTSRLAELEALEGNGSFTGPDAAMWVVQAMSIEQRAGLPLLFAAPLDFPGADAGDVAVSQWLSESTAAMSSFTLIDTEDGIRFEKQAAKDINENGYPENAVVRINQFSSSTIAMESVQIGMDNVPLIAVTLVLMAGYVVLMLGTDTRIPGNSQIKLLLGATCIPALSGGASFGLLGYCGPWYDSLGGPWCPSWVWPSALMSSSC